MDNGYSGAYSKRHRQAEDNAALYAAHVLKQYGWGTERLRQHYDYTHKDCPHKMRAHGGWPKFVKKVQGHLDELNGKKKVTAPPKPSTPKASGSTYRVRKGDSLWAIAKANDTTVAKIKSLNGLKSNVIKVGQTLKVSGDPAPNKKKTPYTVGKWKTNKYGTQYIEAHGTFTVGDSRIMSRFGSPFLSAPEGGYANPGWSTEYHEMCRQDNHIWIGYKVNGKLKYLPVKTWNPKTGAVGKDWGTFK